MHARFTLLAPWPLLTCALIFGLAWVFNAWTPAWGDDWWRMEAPADLDKVASRIADEYRHWTGRWSVLGLTYAFLLDWSGRDLLFRLVNAGFWLLAALTMARAALGRPLTRSGADMACVLSAMAALWLLPVAYGEATLWRTGAIAYLWPMVGAVALVSRLLDVLLQGRRLRWPAALGWSVLGVFVASSLENLGASLLLLGGWLLYAQTRRQRALSGPGLTVILSLVVGLLSNVLAPGNWKRFAAQDDGLPAWVRLPDLLSRIWQVEWHESHLLPLTLALLVLLLGLSPRLRRPDLVVWWGFGLLLAVSMIGATGIAYGGRTAFPAQMIWCIVVLGLVVELWGRARRATPALAWGFTLVVGVATLWAASALTAATQYRSIAAQHQERLQIIAAYQRAGLERIWLPSLRIPYRPGVSDDIVDGPLFIRDIHGDTPGNAWRNSTYGRYYQTGFANRVPQVALLFLPERENPEGRLQPLATHQQSALWATTHAGQPVVYVLAPSGACARYALRWTLADGSQRDEAWTPAQQLAVIAASGQIATAAHCAFFAAIPRHSEAVELLHNGVSSGLRHREPLPHF